MLESIAQQSEHHQLQQTTVKPVSSVLLDLPDPSPNQSLMEVCVSQASSAPQAQGPPRPAQEEAIVRTTCLRLSVGNALPAIIVLRELRMTIQTILWPMEVLSVQREATVLLDRQHLPSVFLELI